MIFAWFYDVTLPTSVDLCGFCYDCHLAGTSAAITASAGAASQASWQERLKAWEELLLKDKLKEMAEEDDAKYEVIVNPHELGVNELEEQYLQASQPSKEWAFWVSRRWWKHRPKMPYTYFLSKVENLEVILQISTLDQAADVLTLRRSVRTVGFSILFELFGGYLKQTHPALKVFR